MANHKSTEKRIRQTKVRRLSNRYAYRSTRSKVRKLRATTSKEEAQKMYPEVCSMLDKLAKRNIIHRNKADNLKSKLALYVNRLAWSLWGQRYAKVGRCPAFLFFMQVCLNGALEIENECPCVRFSNKDGKKSAKGGKSQPLFLLYTIFFKRSCRGIPSYSYSITCTETILQISPNFSKYCSSEKLLSEVRQQRH